MKIKLFFFYLAPEKKYWRVTAGAPAYASKWGLFLVNDNNFGGESYVSVGVGFVWIQVDFAVKVAVREHLANILYL